MPQSAILLVNLGTPAAATPAAVRRYLAQFLSDPFVVKLPRLLWLPLLYGIILPVRAKKSAAKYERIWTTEGSPLAVHTRRQASLLKGQIGEMGHQHTTAVWAMRYGEPSVPQVLTELCAKGIRDIHVIPLFPQYSTTTTASIAAAITAWQAHNTSTANISLRENFHNDAGYIKALAASVRTRWLGDGAPDLFVMSFHGLPQQIADAGDPYPQQCQETANLLAAELKLPRSAWRLTFQSRFGPARWLQPYTQQTLENAARQGVKRIDVICPGFVCDCLETLEEIAMECRDAYRAAGGVEFRYIPCLNENPDWIEALAHIAQQRD